MKPGLCAACRIEPDLCFCALIPRVATRTRFIIVRHMSEIYRPTNSGRIAALALPNSEIVDHGLIGSASPNIDLEGAAVLYPGGTAPGTPPPRRIIVLDASWTQSRRMFTRIPGLTRLPRVTLPAPAAPPERLRRSKVPEQMATLESIAALIELLEGEAAARPLRGLFDLFVQRNVASARRAGRRRATY